MSEDDGHLDEVRYQIRGLLISVETQDVMIAAIEAMYTVKAIEPKLTLPPNVPKHVYEAAGVVSDWIAENNIKNWMIDGLVSKR